MNVRPATESAICADGHDAKARIIAATASAQPRNPTRDDCANK
jgi:hypothetical protein